MFVKGVQSEKKRKILTLLLSKNFIQFERFVRYHDTKGYFRPQQSEFLKLFNAIKRILNKFTKLEETSDKICPNLHFLWEE